ncbi:MAG: TIGR00341 family protein [Rhizobiales bacterium]|nr:TIGR00341 family protein [Hyphomicrobiales bacterium]
MPIRLIEVVAKTGHADTLEAIAEKFDALDVRITAPDEDGKQSVRILAHPDDQQDLLDRLQTTLGSSDDWRILILPVEAIIPDPGEKDEKEKKKKASPSTLREQLFVEISRGAQIDPNFVWLVLLSTVVAAIGLMNNNVAVIIAAMVIAPLLGPNLALAFGTALGDRELILRAALANLMGLTLSIVGSGLIGYFMGGDYTGPEFMTRTELGYDSILLALAAGAAGALSLTSNVSSAVVGVMVAVALLPPAVTFGYMFGIDRPALALAAGTLLAINIACINLTAQLVFFIKGIRPRTWYERDEAKQSSLISIGIWSLLLVGLTVAIYFIRKNT